MEKFNDWEIGRLGDFEKPSAISFQSRPPIMSNAPMRCQSEFSSMMDDGAQDFWDHPPAREARRNIESTVIALRGAREV
jgi:hypothetical protein